jgi:hypothetical protein
VNAGNINRVAQSDWNYDKFDGKGPSRMTLNTDAALISFCDFEWLGVGTVAVGFVVNRCLCYTHFFHHANLTGTEHVYMSTPNLPLSYSIKGETAAAVGSLECICSTVISEGGVQESGHARSHSNGVTNITAGATANTYALVGLRLNSSALDAHVQVKGVSVTSTSTAKDYLVKLIRNPSIAGVVTWTAGLPVDKLTGIATNLCTGGTVMHQTYVNTESSIGVPVEMLPNIGASIAGVSDTFIIAVQPLQANVDCLGAVNWLEME